MPHRRDMVRYAFILLCMASGYVADAFRLPLSSRSIATCVASSQGHHRTASTSTTRNRNQRGGNAFGLSISQTDGDAELDEEIEMMDNDMAREIDAALALAGISAGTIRLSIGLEDADDLIDDLKRAFKTAERL